MTSQARYTQTLLKALHEAQDIARANDQTVTSAHMLLALFIVRNPAERLLRHRGVDEDRLLDQLDPDAREARTVVHELMTRAEQVGASCGSEQTGCLHLLVAMTRSRSSIAHAMLAACGKLSVLRTRALAILTGDMPRWQITPEPTALPAPLLAEPAQARASWRPTTSEIRNRPRRQERGPIISWTPPLVPPGPRRRVALEVKSQPPRALRHGDPAPPPPRPAGPQPRSRAEAAAPEPSGARSGPGARRHSPEDARRQPSPPGRVGRRNPEDARRQPSPPGRVGRRNPEDARQPSPPGQVGRHTPEDARHPQSGELRRQPRPLERGGRHDLEDARQPSPGRPGRHDPEARAPGAPRAHPAADAPRGGRGQPEARRPAPAASDAPRRDQTSPPPLPDAPPSDTRPRQGVALGAPPAPEPDRLRAPTRQLDDAALRTPASVPAHPADPGLADDLDLPTHCSLDPKRFPWLSSLGRNLSEEAAEGRLDRLIGREREVEQLIDVLGKRRANNPILLGEPGVGKTAVVEGLAQQLLTLQPHKIIVSLDVGALLVGTHLRGAFSEKLAGLKEEVRRSRGRVVVFFDEIHTLIGAGGGDGPLDAAGELKAALSRGEFSCIGATTWDEYKQQFEVDPAMSRRFTPVPVPEPSPAQAVAILRKIAPAYGRHHDVSYPEATVRTAVDLSVRFVPDRHLPDKAIALLDLAGSRAARTGSQVVEPALVAELIAERTELPVERLLASDRERLLQLEAELGRQVIGHTAALARIAEVIRRGAAGFRSRRPIGAFLLVGPTGVGKTETAKALARALHGDEGALIRFDLSEFSEAHTVARLVGSPPGYVGFEAGGQLTEQVRARPGRIILFDELEKAHRDVLQLLLQVLDEGQLTDAQGKRVSFADCVIMMTSNLGSDLSKRRGIGFSGGAEAGDDLAQDILKRAQEALAPELWARIEDKLVFGPLDQPELRQIVQLLAEASSGRLKAERGIAYHLEPSAVDWLIAQGGADRKLGARPLRQTLSRLVEGPIAARILEGRLHAGEEVWIRTRPSGGLLFTAGAGGPSLSQLPARS